MPGCGARNPPDIASRIRIALRAPGDISSDGVILVTILRAHSADSALTFEVAENPKPGQVGVFLDFGGCTEPLHLPSPSRLPSSGSRGKAIAMRGWRSSAKRTLVEQGVRSLPPENRVGGSSHSRPGNLTKPSYLSGPDRRGQFPCLAHGKLVSSACLCSAQSIHH